MNKYTTAPIGATMLKTAVSMLPGTLAISGYNIADTYFVSGLGTLPLAAMGYTFPVIMFLNCIYRGLGVGVMTTVAQSLGAAKKEKAAKLVTAGIALITVVAAMLSFAGYFCIDYTFALFGASSDVMPYIKDYMVIIYIGSLTIALAMTGNDVMIASGFPKTASLMMIIGMLLNVILDPIMIFGWAGFPAMGMKGAAIATVISQGIAAATVFLLLYYKHRLISIESISFRTMGMAWDKIIRFAVPSIIGMLLMPIGGAVVTKVIAGFGDAAVAAAAAAGRLEVVAFIFPMALGISIMPMVGQNYGARLYSRIDACRKFSMKFAFFFELGMAVVYFAAAPYLVRFFTDDPNVMSVMITYLRIIPLGFGLIEIHRYGGFFYTGCGRPSVSAWLNVLRILILLIPLSLLAAKLNSLTGVFVARLATDIIAGAVAFAAAAYLTGKLPKDGMHYKRGKIKIPVEEQQVMEQI